MGRFVEISSFVLHKMHISKPEMESNQFSVEEKN